jgi:hypothetical protein
MNTALKISFRKAILQHTSRAAVCGQFSAYPVTRRVFFVWVAGVRGIP